MPLHERTALTHNFLRSAQLVPEEAQLTWNPCCTRETHQLASCSPQSSPNHHTHGMEKKQSVLQINHRLDRFTSIGSHSLASLHYSRGGRHSVRAPFFEKLLEASTLKTNSTSYWKEEEKSQLKQEGSSAQKNVTKEEEEEINSINKLLIVWSHTKKKKEYRVPFELGIRTHISTRKAKQIKKKLIPLPTNMEQKKQQNTP